MSAKKNIFVIGATGYIGGSIVSHLLEHPDANSFQITALVRSPEKAAKLESVGIKAIVGSFTEFDKVEQLASEADIVFSSADADNLEAVRAQLRGIKRRHEITGTPPILIHTSGTGVVADFTASGKFSYDTIHSDLEVEKIESIPSTAIHRNVDSEIVKADTEGYVKTYIILPGSVYAIPTGKLADIGVQHIHSMQIPFYIQTSIDRAQTSIVGEGKNVWPNVHISELADLYMIVFDSALTKPTTPHGREGFYYAESDEGTLYEVVKEVAKVLTEYGKVKSPELTQFTAEELEQKPLYLAYFGTHCRARADRARAIGWKPVKTTKDMVASVRPQVDAILKGL